MLLILSILLSAILYRVPRGGPDAEGWRQVFGFGGFGSFWAGVIWAVGTAVPMVLILGLPWWVIPAVVVFLVLAEMPQWADYWPNRPDGGSFWKLTFRGTYLLNPLMGVIYFGLYHIRRYVPDWDIVPGLAFLRGWTAWAELLSGLVTATVLAFLLTLLELWI